MSTKAGETYNSLRLSRDGQQPRTVGEATYTPTPGRSKGAGARCRPAAAGYMAYDFLASSLTVSRASLSRSADVPEVFGPLLLTGTELPNIRSANAFFTSY